MQGCGSKCFLSQPRGVGQPLPIRPQLRARASIARCRVLNPATGSDLAPAQDAPVAPYAQVTESTAVYTSDPAGYQRPIPRPQEYYAAPPPMYYPPPPPPAYKAEESSGLNLPWWIWVGVGVLGTNVFIKVQEFTKNPQAKMLEMMMKQASAGAAGGTSPFGASPFGAQAPPFGGQASPFGGQMPPFPSSGFAPPKQPAVDVSASPVQQSAPAAAAPTPTPSNDSSKKGEKFSARISSEGRTTDSTNGSTVRVKSSMEVVEPLVKEPSRSSSSNGNDSSSAAPKPAFFTDISAEEAAKNSSAGSSAGQSTTSSSGSSDANSDAGISAMMEQMLRNPEMQKMLYPYLPEPMRNPQSIEWMLNNPEVKKQMEEMFKSQNMMSPQMQEMMKSMDFNQEKVNKQFQELGLKPEDVIQKVMANPDLAAGFSNPKVQAAIMDISANPMNIMKYQNDPEVMKVLEKVTEIFQPSIPPNMR